MEHLPFSAGLQIIHADDFAHGRPRAWTRDNRAPDFDSLSEIDAALKRLNDNGTQIR